MLGVAVWRLAGRVCALRRPSQCSGAGRVGGIGEAQLWTEVKVIRLGTESGLQLPEGSLAQSPLLLLLLPLLLLCF